MYYVVFNDSGLIIRSGSCYPNELWLQAFQASESVLEHTDLVAFGTHYVDVYDYFAIKKCPTFNESTNKLTMVSDGVDSIIISGIPIGTVVSVDGENYVVDDGIIKLTVKFPGVYKVKLSGFPYLDKIIEVTAI